MVLIHFSMIAIGQDVLRNNFSIGTNRGGGGNLFSIDSSFLCIGGMVNSLDFNHGIYSSKVNYNLVPTDINEFQYVGQSLGLPSLNSVVEAIDSGYFGVINLDLETPRLIKFDENGDTIWSKPILDLSLGQYAGFVITQAQDSCLYLAGTRLFENVEAPWRHVIVKCTKSGDYLWHTETVNGAANWPGAILVTDGAIVVGGKYTSNALDIANGRNKQFQAKYDLTGNLIWLKTVQALPIGSETGIVGLYLLDNGNYLYGASRTEGIDTQQGETANTNNRPVIGEIDSETGEVLWETGFGEYLWEHRFLNFKRTNDGGYIGVGQHIDDFSGPSQGWPIGMIIRFDANFNMLWYRSYVPEAWNGMGRWNELDDVIENNNGTYTALGMLYTNTGTGPFGGWIQDTYMITVNEHGCLVEGCETGIREVEHEDAIVVYPNPAQEQLNLSIGDHRVQQWHILDLAGSVVLQGGSIAGSNPQIDINTLASGLYTFCIYTSNGLLLTSKFLKDE